MDSLPLSGHVADPTPRIGPRLKAVGVLRVPFLGWLKEQNEITILLSESLSDTSKAGTDPPKCLECPVTASMVKKKKYQTRVWLDGSPMICPVVFDASR